VIRPVPLATYLSWNRTPQPNGQVQASLLDINNVLKSARVGLTFRQYDRAQRYVECARPFFTVDTALDFQLKQVILTRLRSSTKGFERTVQALGRFVPTDRFPQSAEMLTRILELKRDHEFVELL
jgi:hypothetical protein